MGIIRDLYYARKISAGAKLPAPTVALLIKRLYLASRMGGGEPGHQVTVTGTLPMVITNAVAEAIHNLTRYGLCAYAPGIWNTAITQYGKCTQDGTPTPDAPVDIMCNNGALKYGALGANLLDPSAANVLLGYYINKADGEVKPSPANFIFEKYMPVEPGKTYVAYGREKSGGDLSDYNRVAWYDSNKTWIMGADYIQNRIAVVTAPENAAYARLSFNPSGTSTMTVTQEIVDSYNWTFAEGTAEITPFIPFVGGIYTDGTPEELTVGGTNLVDLTAVTDDYYYSPSGVYTAVSNARLTDYISVRAGQKYTAYVANRGSAFVFNVRVNLFSTDRVWLSQSVTPVNQPSVIVITTPEDGYLRLSANYKGTDPTSSWADWSTLQIVVGEYTLETMPPYAPYVQPQTASVPMLLGVGDYKDAAELISGIKTGKVGVKVLNGTEDWTKGSVGSLNYYYGGDTNLDGNAEKELMCNQFAIGTRNVQAIGKICVRNARNGFLITPNDQTLDTTAKFKQWLAAQYAAGTPVIVVYPLAAETTEQTTAYPQLCNQLYDTADVTAEVDDISVTFTTGEQTEPNQYSPLDILCNNGALVWDGSEVVAVGTPEQLTVRPGMHLRLTGADFEPGTINDETGADDDNYNDVRTSGYIDVVPGEAYAIYWKLDDRLNATCVDMWLYYYDAENNLIGVFEDDSPRGPERRGYSFIAAEDCVKLRVSGKMTDTAVTPLDVVYLGIDTIGTAATSPAGKNLFCFETSMFGKLIQNSGAIADLKTNLVSDFIEVEAGVRYVLSGYTGNVAENNIRIGLYGADKSQIGNIRYMPSQTNAANLPFVGSFLVPENGKYTRFTMPIACSDVMLERGSAQDGSDTRTEYEPYVDESWQTASVVDLLAVGDHKDDQDLVNGAVHRRTAACRYDGTQTIGDEYMSTTGGKDIGAIIVYPTDLASDAVTPQPLTLWAGTNQIDSVSNVGPLTAQIKYYAATAQDVLSALLGTTVGPSDISTQDAETMINVITGGDT